MQLSLRAKMLVWFGGILGAMLVVFALVTYSSVQETVVGLTKDLAHEILKARSAEIGRLIHGYSSEVKTIADRDVMRSGDFDVIGKNLIERAHTINPDFEILFYTDNRGHFTTTMGAEGDVSDRDYFKAIMEQGQDDVISPPLLSKSTGERVFVVASVVRNDKGERIGMAAATVLLKRLSQITESISIGQGGTGWVADGNGTIVAHRDQNLPLKLNLLRSAASGYEGLDEIGRRIVAGQPGQGIFKRPDGTTQSAIFNPIPYTPGWTFGISVQQSELMKRPEVLMRQILLLMAAMLGTMLLVVTVLSRRITEPVRALQEGVASVRAGNLDSVIDVRTGDEIQALAEAFNRMTADLKDHIRNLQKVTAEKERVESDLRVANKIQAGMLPRVFPPFFDIEHVDLYATMEPAKEVGGDFFDFFLLDDHRLCFCIGDVSGKGVPAALFMVITMTILRNQAMHHKSLETVFNQANAMLCADNDESMFVTVFMGILDLDTGDLEYVSAGHNPPFISVGGAGFGRLAVQPGLVMGGMAGHEYRSSRTVMRPGDLLFLYTDGVTEAMNIRLEAFGEDLATQTLNGLMGQPVRAVIKGMRQAIDGFTQGAPVSDDVAMMAITLTGLPARGKRKAADKIDA